MISVIIPLYNKEAIIDRTLRSVLSQNYDDFEVIVVNDGSTDGSVEIVKSINDKRVRIIEQHNGGPSKARNTGIENALGDWLYFIDADDEMEPGSLKHFSELIKQFPQADMFLGEVSFNEGKNKVQSTFYQDGFIDNIFKSMFYHEINPCSGTLLYRKSLCVQHPYREDIRRFEDLECLLNKFRTARLYATHFPTSVVNIEYAQASHGRKYIKEDFLGHLYFKGKSFWEKMCLYQFYLGERSLYKDQVEKLYPVLLFRYDILVLYKLLKFVYVHFKCYKE